MGGGSDIFEMGAAGMIPAMFNKAGQGGTPGLEGLFTGGAGGAPGTPPPAVPPAPGVPTRQLPGYSGAGGSVPLFGRLNPEQLAAYNKQHGTAPVRPPINTAAAAPPPAKKSLFAARRNDDSEGD